jgi:hypothetical protein
MCWNAFAEAAEQRTTVAHGDSRGFGLARAKPRTGAAELFVRQFFFRPCRGFMCHVALPMAVAMGYFLSRLRRCGKIIF